MNKDLSQEYRKLWFYSKGIFYLSTFFIGVCITLIGIGVCFWINECYYKKNGVYLQSWQICLLTGPVVGILRLVPEIADKIVTRVICGNKFKTMLQAFENNFVENLKSYSQSNMPDTEKIKCIKKAIIISDKLQNMHWYIPKINFDDQISSTIISILSLNSEDYKHLLDWCACNRKSTQGKKHDKISFKYKHAYQNLSLIPFNKYFKERYDVYLEPSVLTKILDGFNERHDQAIKDRAFALETQFIQEEIQYNKVKKG